VGSLDWPVIVDLLDAYKVSWQFDTSTPGANNDAANGHARGPAAAPRDDLPLLGDFYEAFDFSQDPHYYPPLPEL